MEITNKELLAIEAVTYGCNTNKKCANGSFVRDIKNYVPENEISFEDAIITVYDLIDKIKNNNKKLTKKEKMFCEFAETGWIVRDDSGMLYWYKEKPNKFSFDWNSDSNMLCIEDINECCELTFSFITWQDTEPWSVEDLLKLEVEE